MSDDYSDELNSINNSIGQRLKSLRLDAGYKSYEVFAWENNLSRIQYWKMENGKRDKLCPKKFV
jgi:hypothetical protein